MQRFLSWLQPFDALRERVIQYCCALPPKTLENPAALKTTGKGRTGNNFGAARLILATIVILSHSPELIDGNRSREPLAHLFPAVSFGRLAVDGFFLISGYLITQSWLSSPSPKTFLTKRIMRIFPGFAAAFLVSLLIAGPLGGGRVFDDPMLWLINLKRFLLLQAPLLPSAFAGTPYPALNGSMWSIGYEFRCYLAVLTLGLGGCFARRNIFLAATLALAGASAAMGENVIVWPHALDGFIGTFGLSLSFFGVYACGVCFFLFREKIAYTPTRCVMAAVALGLGLRAPHLSTLAIETAGAYLLFAFIFAIKSRRIRAIGSRIDLSYGIYLYAFPVQKLVILWTPDISPAALDFIAIAFSVACAYISWTIIEKPALSLRRPERQIMAMDVVQSDA